MEPTLETLRAELDGIDEQLLATIAARLRCCERIGHFKKTHAVAMMQPQRIGVVKARAVQFGAANGVSGEFLERLYDVIIAETCRLEEQIIGG